MSRASRAHAERGLVVYFGSGQRLDETFVSKRQLYQAIATILETSKPARAGPVVLIEVEKVTKLSPYLQGQGHEAYSLAYSFENALRLRNLDKSLFGSGDYQAMAHDG